jgi:hypothetical protein
MRDRIGQQLAIISAARTAPCLAAAAQLLRKESVVPVNFEADWENAEPRLLSHLVREAHARGA